LRSEVLGATLPDRWSRVGRERVGDERAMCTLVVLHRCIAGRPLVVAANRDEFYHRPAEGVALRSSGTGRILSPLDLEAGGTWVGLSQAGVFAGLTNLRPLGTPRADSGAERGRVQPGVADSSPSPDLKSRGSVVMQALEADSAMRAVESLSKLEEAAYNPFQLLVADGRDAFLIVYRDRVRTIELEPGAHVVGNVEDDRIAAAIGTADALTSSGDTGLRELTEAYPGFEGVEDLIDTAEPRARKLTRIRERVEKMVTNPGIDLFEGLARICREHVDQIGVTSPENVDIRKVDTERVGEGEIELGEAEGDKQSPFEATCVHIADRYGTRSSLLLELCEDQERNRLWTTDGPPCERPFENRSSLLRDLGVRLN